MDIAFTSHAWEEYLYWHEHDQAMLAKIHLLLKEIQRDPFRGIGKPEPLKENYAGYWSRKISPEHRIIYKITGSKPNQVVVIVQLRFHY